MGQTEVHNRDYVFGFDITMNIATDGLIFKPDGLAQIAIHQTAIVIGDEADSVGVVGEVLGQTCEAEVVVEGGRIPRGS